MKTAAEIADDVNNQVVSDLQITPAQFQRWALEIYQQACTDAANQVQKGKMDFRTFEQIMDDILALRDSKQPSDF